MRDGIVQQRATESCADSACHKQGARMHRKLSGQQLPDAAPSANAQHQVNGQRAANPSRWHQARLGSDINRIHDAIPI